MVATGRGTQVVPTPVIDHVLPVAVFDRKSFPLVECVVRACSTFSPPIIAVGATLVMAILLAAALGLCLFIATTLVAIPIIRDRIGQFRRIRATQGPGATCSPQ